MLAIFYTIFGKQLIRQAYDDSLSGHPSLSFIDHRKESLDHYLGRGDKIFWEYIFFGVPLTLLFWFLFAKLTKKLLSQSGSKDCSVQSSGDQFKYDWLVAGLVYTALTLIYFAPALSTFTTSMIGPPGDNMAGYWSFWWGFDKVLMGSGSLTSSNYLYYPEGSSLYYFAWSFYNLFLSFFLRLFFGAVTVYNLVILHGYPIAGIGAFLLVRYFTNSSFIALIGGFIFAFSPNHFARSLHHLHINSIQFIPFFVLSFIRAVKGSRVRDLLPAIVFFLLNALCEWTYMILAGYFMLFSYMYLAIQRHRLFLKDVAAKIGIITGSTLLLLSPWLWSMTKIGLRSPEVDVGGRNTYVTDLLGLFVPGHCHWLGGVNAIAQVNGAFTGNYAETSTYLGLGCLILVVIAFRRIVLRISKFLLGGASFLIMALGPQIHVLGKSLPVGLPYTVIAFVPFLSNVRCPSRFMVYVYLFWSVIVALAIKSILESSKSHRWRIILSVAIPLLLFVDFLSFCNLKTEVSVPPCYQAIKQGAEPFGILDLPVEYEQVCRYMMYQTFHGFPIVEGAATRKIGKSLIDRLEFKDLPRQRQQLIDGRVKYVVIHKQLPSSEPLDSEPYRRTYTPIFEDDENLVLEVY